MSRHWVGRGFGSRLVMDSGLVGTHFGRVIRFAGFSFWEGRKPFLVRVRENRKTKKGAS